MTPEKVKRIFAEHGLSVREFARLNGYSESLVYAVLAGKNKASRGESHRIAVSLGLKPEPQLAEVPSFVQSMLVHHGLPTASAFPAKEPQMS